FTLGSPGIAPSTTSSMLGCAAAVIATVSPSQPRPAVIQRMSSSAMTGARIRFGTGAMVMISSAVRPAAALQAAAKRDPGHCIGRARSFLFQLLQEGLDLLAVRHWINPGVFVDDLSVQADDEGPARRGHRTFKGERLLVRVSGFHFRAG